MADYVCPIFRNFRLKTTSGNLKGCGRERAYRHSLRQVAGVQGFVEFRDELQRKLMQKFGPSGRFHQVSAAVNKNLEENRQWLFEDRNSHLREKPRRGSTFTDSRKSFNRLLLPGEVHRRLRNCADVAHVLGPRLSHILPNV